MLPQEFNLMNFYTGTSSAGSDMFASLILFFFFLPGNVLFRREIYII